VTYLGNSPQATTVLRLEARKSFALSVWVRDANGRPLDIADTSLRIVMMKRLPRGADPGEPTNLLAHITAETVDAVEGLARFNIQAADLNHAPGEYPFAIVMDTNGYSTVAAKGVVDLQQNTEFASINSTYAPSNAPAGVTLNIDERSQLTLQTGPTLAPGTTSFTDGDKEKLDNIEAGAQVNVEASWLAEEGQPGYIRYRPRFGSAAFSDIEDLLALPTGGAPGEVLVKITNDDYQVGWQQPSSNGGGGVLPAAGVTAGYVPTATGVGGWGWAAIVSGVEAVNGKQGVVTLTLNDLADTTARLAMTPAERTKLAELDTSISYENLLDKPVLGTVATLDTEDVLQPGEVDAADIVSGVLDPARIPSVSSLPGFRSGTATPSGGFDGELYFQYT
jgi:hypothetical protein